MNDEWQATTGKPLIVGGKEVKAANLGLTESQDWQIAHTMERRDSEMQQTVRRLSREVAREEDAETLETVREALAEMLHQLDAILHNREPAPESPLGEILRRLDALEGWAFRQGARL